jgi:hypothetical protein
MEANNLKIATLRLFFPYDGAHAGDAGDAVLV